MSLAIDTDRVIRVLLADGWHHVEAQTFDLDAYEYLEYNTDEQGRRTGYPLLGGGSCAQVPHTGFSFMEAKTGRLLLGPITSILAVEINRR